MEVPRFALIGVIAVCVGVLITASLTVMWAASNPSVPVQAAVNATASAPLAAPRITQPAPPQAQQAIPAAPAAAPPGTAPQVATPTPRPPTATPAPPTPTPGGEPAKRGEVVTGKNWTYQVTNVEKTKALTGGEYSTPEEALGVWVIVYLTLQNTARENHPINNHDFELHESGGTKYDPSTGSGIGVFSFLRSRKLTTLGSQFPPGVAVNSAVVFDVNPAAAGLKLWLVQEKRYIDLGI